MPLPSPFWAVRMLWQDSNVAIGETYFNNAASLGTPPTGLYATSLALFKARSLLMGNAIVPIGFRISQVGLFRAYINSDPDDVSSAAVGPLALTVNTKPAVIAAGGNNVVDGTADQGPDAVIVNYIGPSIQQHSRHYLSGVPDVLTRINPNGPWVVGVGSWWSLFQAYVAILQANGWQMRCRTIPSIPNPPATVVFSLDPTNAFLQVTCNTIPLPAAGPYILQIRGAQMTSKAYKTVNGSWPVKTVGAAVGGQTTYTLAKAPAYNYPFIVPAFGTAQLVDYTPCNYTLVTLGREATHKRGNRVLAAPGRRKIVQRI